MSKFSLYDLEKHVFPRETHCEEDELARMWTLYPRDG